MPLKAIAADRLAELMPKVDSALQFHLDEYKVELPVQYVLFDGDFHHETPREPRG